MHTGHTGAHPAANAVANHTSVDTGSLESTIAALPASVQGRLHQIFAAGSVRPDDLEPRVVLELMEFGESGACTILDRYGSKNLSAVRNKASCRAVAVRLPFKATNRTEATELLRTHHRIQSELGV